MPRLTIRMPEFRPEETETGPVRREALHARPRVERWLACWANADDSPV